MLSDETETRRRRLKAFFAIIVVEIILIVVALSIRPAIQAIPGRYRSRLPDFLQRMAEREHAETLPTPNVISPIGLPTFIVTQPTPTPTPFPPTRTPLVQPPTREGTLSALPLSTITPTPPPTLTPTPTTKPIPAVIAESTAVDLERAVVELDGVTHVYQLWNNCGPATLTMALSFYGWTGDQKQAAEFLKPNQEDKNVNPSEMAEFIRGQGLEVVLRYGGDVHLIQKLLLAGFPVLIEKGFDPEPDRLGWMGHYLLIVGYSEFDRSFRTMDSYLGPDQIEPYEVFDSYWKDFNRTYLVIYRPEQEADLESVLGDDMNQMVNFWNTLAINIAEVNANPKDAFAWFNLGTSYTQVGYYPDAAGAFDQARLLGLPWRMLWYQHGPYQAYYQLGRYDDILTLTDATLATTTEVEETYYYKGLALQAKGDVEGARAAYKEATKFNPNYLDAIKALSALPPES